MHTMRHNIIRSRMSRRCGLVVQRASSCKGGRAFDLEPWQPLSHSIGIGALHPSSGILLAGSVRFKKWLDGFKKIENLAKIGGRTALNPIHTHTKKKAQQNILVPDVTWSSTCSDGWSANEVPLTIASSQTALSVSWPSCSVVLLRFLWLILSMKLVANIVLTTAGVIKLPCGLLSNMVSISVDRR